MPKVTSKKFVLVNIDDNGDSAQTIRRLRRYLASHKMKYICSSNPEEMKEYLDKLQNHKLTFQENVGVQVDTIQPDNSSPTNTSTNQEILEQWARGAFSENSNTIFFAAAAEQEESANESEQEPENTIIDIPQLFTVHSIEPEIKDAPKDPFMPENGKQDNQNTAYCLICDSNVEVGRNRNTIIKRQAQHVIDSHSRDEFSGVEIEKRYQCACCKKILPVSKSPCEHITDHHGNNDNEIEFLDLWTKEQTSIFNTVLEKCFERHLPVPRSRRVRCESTCELLPKASYRIIQGEDIVKILTVATSAEKPRTTGDRNDEEDEAASSALVNQGTPSSSENDDLYVEMSETDPGISGVATHESDHDYFKVDGSNPIADNI